MTRRPLTSLVVSVPLCVLVVLAFLRSAPQAAMTPSSKLGKPVACVGTQFAHKGDKWAGEKFFCLNRKVDNKTLGVASRTLPCHSLVLVTNIRTGRSVRARVIDTGPYWSVPSHCDPMEPSCWKQGRPIVRKVLHHSTGRKFAGCIDITEPTAQRIGLNGKEPVIVYPLRIGR